MVNAQFLTLVGLGLAHRKRDSIPHAKERLVIRAAVNRHVIRIADMRLSISGPIVNVNMPLYVRPNGQLWPGAQEGTA